MTGWFNIVGLVGIVASVGYGAALFLDELFGLYGAGACSASISATTCTSSPRLGSCSS